MDLTASDVSVVTMKLVDWAAASRADEMVLRASVVSAPTGRTAPTSADVFRAVIVSDASVSLTATGNSTPAFGRGPDVVDHGLCGRDLCGDRDPGADLSGQLGLPDGRLGLAGVQAEREVRPDLRLPLEVRDGRGGPGVVRAHHDDDVPGGRVLDVGDRSDGPSRVCADRELDTTVCGCLESRYSALCGVRGRSDREGGTVLGEALYGPGLQPSQRPTWRL